MVLAWGGGGRALGPSVPSYKARVTVDALCLNTANSGSPGREGLFMATRFKTANSRSSPKLKSGLSLK